MKAEIIAARNQWCVEGKTAVLTIVRRTGEAMDVVMDRDMMAEAQHYCWRLATGRCGTIYASAGDLFLHHLVMGKPEDGLLVYFANNNTLDCRKSNLRLGTRSDATANGKRAKTQPGTGYVCKSNNGRRFCAYTYARDGGSRYLGTFDSRAEARAAHMKHGKWKKNGKRVKA